MAHLVVVVVVVLGGGGHGPMVGHRGIFRGFRGMFVDLTGYGERGVGN